MSHEPTEQTIEPTDAEPPESDPTPQLTRLAFYVLAVVLTAGDAMLVGLGTDGFWLMEAALLPLAFLLCLAGALLHKTEGWRGIQFAESSALATSPSCVFEEVRQKSVERS